jgi:hypothetical protein
LPLRTSAATAEVAYLDKTPQGAFPDAEEQKSGIFRRYNILKR